jgi:lipopolysaccharide/colanic/teichoic acid biosynthesis glycosyltransferase
VIRAINPFTDISIGEVSATVFMKDYSYRMALTDELYNRYGSGSASLSRRWRFWRKKYAWSFVIGSATALKRFIDIVASLILLMTLSPLFLVVAILIKLTDGGPVLFWQTRVGRWGREFPFPKFRSMVVNAEKLKDDLLQQNDHGQSVTFKMKRDPRITWIGRIIRKLSIDELPQLICVFNGHMSLVGPRPPLPREVALYTLADRRRLDVIPGLTCIWQVSGRGDIPFDQQVELDVEYIESQSFWFDIKLLLKTVPAVLFGRGAY